jgi:hypothetical protein
MARPAQVIGITLLLIAATIAGTAGTASALKYNEIGEPELETTVDGSNVLEPGTTTTVGVVIRNTGQSVTEVDGESEVFESTVQRLALQPGAALSTTVTAEAGSAPLTVRTAEQAVGAVATDSTRQVPIEVEVDEGAAPGVYEIPVEVSYRYLNILIVNDDNTITSYRTETVERNLVVRVDSAARLEVVSVTGDGLTEDADGELHATVRNVGTEAATNAALRLHGADWMTPRASNAGVGTLNPNETASATFRVGVGDITAGNHSVGFSLRYDDANGVISETPIRTGTVRTGEGPRFDVSASAESLYVDSTGAVALTVRNTGDSVAQNVRVQLRESQPLTPVSGSASLNDLAPGEAATARLRVEVSDRALAGEYPLSVVVERNDAFGDPVATEPLSAGVEIGPERTFETGDAGSAPAGSTTTIAFEVTNTGEAPMRDAVVRLNANSPFETDDDTAYIGTLEPGESTTARFTVSVDDAATAKAYALDTTIAFDNAFDRRVVTDIESTELRVEAGGGGALTALLKFLGL